MIWEPLDGTAWRYVEAWNQPAWPAPGPMLRTGSAGVAWESDEWAAAQANRLDAGALVVRAWIWQGGRWQIDAKNSIGI